MIRTVLGFMLILGAWLNSQPTAAADTSAGAALSEAEKQAELLLWATGGREAWAGVTNTVVYSDLYRRDDGRSVGAVSTIDYRAARLRIDTTGPHLQAIRIIDREGDRSWRLNAHGKLEKVPEDQLARDLRHYTAQVFRTLQRIAVRDPKLRLAIGKNGSLEVYEGPTRIAWYVLDARGQPYAMGAHDDNVGVICGPWEIEKRDIHYPLWVSRPDGSWRATLRSLVVDSQIDEKFFTPSLAIDQ
jgi:hypothetical protein